VELIFILSVVLFQILFVNLFEVVKVVGTFRIDAFMDDEVLPVLFGNKDVVAVRTT
jgi:hypothetical protein